MEIFIKIVLIVTAALIISFGIWVILSIIKSILDDLCRSMNSKLYHAIEGIDVVRDWVSIIFEILGIAWIIGVIIFMVSMIIWCIGEAISDMEL